MTFAEIVAYKRDIKRRRMKYRTTKEPPLSRTEEVRRLIDTQMEALIQYLKPEEKEIEVPSCSETIQRKKIVSPEKIYSSSGSSRRNFDYNRSDSQEMKSDYTSHHRKIQKRSKSRSRSRIYTPSSSKSNQRKKSVSPAKTIYNRSDSKSHHKKNKRSRSRSRSHRRDRSPKREHKKGKHKRREISRSRSRDRNCDYKKRKNK